MSDSDVKCITLFFFFTMLDERLALRAASETLELCLRRLESTPKIKPNVLIVSATTKIWTKYRKGLTRGRPQFSLESGWRIPDSVDFSPWKEFQKKAPEEELLALVWSKILHFSDEDISQGLGLTEGTLRFRVGRALRKMGAFCQSTDKFFKVVRSHE
jgi:hypothetical protein